MKSLHTCCLELSITASTHHQCEEHTHIFLRTDYICLFLEIVWDHFNNIKEGILVKVDIDPGQVTRGDQFNACA